MVEENTQKGKAAAFFRITLKIVLFFSFCILLYSATLYIFINLSNEIAKNILEYLKVLIWPSVALLTIFVFKTNIALLIGRMEEFDFPFFKGRAKSVYQPQESVQKDIVVAQNEGEDFKAVVAEKEAEIKALRDSTEDLIAKLTRAQIELEFERIYNLIFRSQIELLSKMNTVTQVEFSYVIQHFFALQKQFPEVFKDWNPYKYIQFLITNNLVEYEYQTSSVSITQKGKAFVAYLVLMNYQKYGI